MEAITGFNSAILKSCVIVFIAAIFGHANSQSLEADFRNLTSKALSVDDWLFSDDLFPGHAIPQHVSHTDAIRMFTSIMDDHNVITEAYNRFRVQHDRTTEDEVKFDVRRHHFKDNLHFIFQHNLQHDSGHFGFQTGVNMFADMSRDEMTHFLGANDKIPVHPKNFNATGPGYGGPMGPPQPPVAGPPSPVSTTAFPHSYDLRDYDVVSPIKNQKKCGSCVFFAHAGLIETLYALKNNGEIINTSEQMMLDCATPEHGYVNNGGCNGNIMEDSGQFLVDHGVTTEDLYKYTAKQETCAKADKNVVARLSEYHHIEPTVEAFKHTIVNEQKPIAVAFLVFPQFMFYRTGVYDFCKPPHGYTGGHAVLITGYGHFFDQEYWLVKNSWGQRWGEKGYFRYIAGNSFCRFERWGFTGTLA